MHNLIVLKVDEDGLLDFVLVNFDKYVVNFDKYGEVVRPGAGS